LLPGVLTLLAFQKFPVEHPNVRDTRKAIATCALSASRSLPASRKRRELMMLWWKILGWGALPLARSVLQWKLNPASRPIAIKRLAKLMRATAG
jgi:hypothetical protein